MSKKAWGLAHVGSRPRFSVWNKREIISSSSILVVSWMLVPHKLKHMLPKLKFISLQITTNIYQTCSMSWGVLSSNVSSGKTWWSTVLLSIAPDCLCYNVLYDRGFLWWHDLNPMKIGKNPLGSWIQGSAGYPGAWAFFSKFWPGKQQNWIRREWGL